MVWAAVMMGLEESWRDVIAALLGRTLELQACGELAADALGPAAVRQLFHVRQPSGPSCLPFSKPLIYERIYIYPEPLP